MENREMHIYMPRNAIFGMFKVNSTSRKGDEFTASLPRKAQVDIVTG